MLGGGLRAARAGDPPGQREPPEAARARRAAAGRDDRQPVHGARSLAGLLGVGDTERGMSAGLAAGRMLARLAWRRERTSPRHNLAVLRRVPDGLW